MRYALKIHREKNISLELVVPSAVDPELVPIFGQRFKPNARAAKFSPRRYATIGRVSVNLFRVVACSPAGYRHTSTLCILSRRQCPGNRPTRACTP